MLTLGGFLYKRLLSEAGGDSAKVRIRSRSDQKQTNKKGQEKKTKKPLGKEAEDIWLEKQYGKK